METSWTRNLLSDETVLEMPTTYTLIDPFTGEPVQYVNPWTYDPSLNAWLVDDVTYVTGEDFNNLLRYGQPFNPSNIYTGQFYIHEIEDIVPALGPTVIFSQYNVLTEGIGSSIDFDDFDLVKDLKAGVYSAQLEEGRVYTLSELQALGISPQVIGENGQDYGDHALSTDLYGTGQVYPGASSPFEWAYIFGSIRVRISEDTTFSIVDGKLVIDGRIELFDDDFNHVGGLPPVLSALVQLGAGDVASFEESCLFMRAKAPKEDSSKSSTEMNVSSQALSSPPRMRPRSPSSRSSPATLFSPTTRTGRLFPVASGAPSARKSPTSWTCMG